MAVGLDWKVEKRVAYIIFSRVPDMDRFKAIHRDLIGIMDEATAPVHLIFDVRDLEQFPPLVEFIRSPYLTHPQKGQVIVIGLSEKPLFRILVNSLVSGLRMPVHSVDSLDEAQAVLLQLDASLKWD